MLVSWSMYLNMQHAHTQARIQAHMLVSWLGCVQNSIWWSCTHRTHSMSTSGTCIICSMCVQRGGYGRAQMQAAGWYTTKFRGEGRGWWGMNSESVAESGWSCLQQSSNRVVNSVTQMAWLVSLDLEKFHAHSPACAIALSLSPLPHSSALLYISIQ